MLNNYLEIESFIFIVVVAGNNQIYLFNDVYVSHSWHKLHFYKKINIAKCFFYISNAEIRARCCQKLDVILVTKLFKNWSYILKKYILQINVFLNWYSSMKKNRKIGTFLT